MSSAITRVLFLDDSEQRQRSFERLSIGQGMRVYQAMSAEVAQTFLLTTDRFDVACLDHDLSEEDIMCPPGGPARVPTGMDVVDYIVAMGPDYRPKFVVVHTHNTPAGDEMMRRLGEADVPCGRWPFMNMAKIMQQTGTGVMAIPGVAQALEGR